MSKKHKEHDARRHAEGEASEEAAPKRSKKARIEALERRVDALADQIEALGRVVDEAIRATIAVREKAPDVRPRRRAKPAPPAA